MRVETIGKVAIVVKPISPRKSAAARRNIRKAHLLRTGRRGMVYRPRVK